MRNLEIIPTADGSYTLYDSSLDETYHSRSGAWSESKYVYIEMGLQDFPLNEVRVLEIGFGTGTNAILTFQYAGKFYFKVDYLTIEPFPLEWNLIDKMQFDNKLGSKDWEIFKEMHQTQFGDDVDFGNTMKFKKRKVTLEDLQVDSKFDLIYFDAFAPSKQADIWSIENMKKLYEILDPGGKLVSYSAQGQFKRNLKEVGFSVENPPGPHHKKEMTVAIKS